MTTRLTKTKSAYTSSRRGIPLGPTMRDKDLRLREKVRRDLAPKQGDTSKRGYNTVRDKLSQLPSKDRFKVPATAHKRKPPMTRG